MKFACKTTIISPAVRYLASLFTRDSIFIYVAACNSNEKLVYKRGGAQPGGMYQSLLSALKVEFNLMIKRQLSNLQIQLPADISSYTCTLSTKPNKSVLSSYELKTW